MFEIADILRIALTGISWGMILFLIASGLSLILGVMGILNLAHGALYMLGAYLGIALLPVVGNFWIAALISGLAVCFIGLLLERGFLKRLYKQFNEQVLLTLGFVYIFSNLVIWIWGGFQKLGTVPAGLDFSIPIGRLDFPVYRLALIGIGLAVAAGLWYLQNRTRVGAVVRAGMDDREMVQGMGINYSVVATGVFLLGVFIAGIAGMLGSPYRGAGPDQGFTILIQALIVVVVGGVGRVEGTLLGALIIGLLDSLGKQFFPDFSEFTVYVFFILILLVKPSGLLGRVQIGNTAPPPSAFRAPRIGVARAFKNWQHQFIKYLPFVLILAGLIVFPQVASTQLRTTMTYVLIYGILALSLNLLFGYTGMFSLGHAAFFGMGAYASAYLYAEHGVESFWLLLPAGMLAATVTAAIFGIIALRVKGTYFLFVTLALAELLRSLAANWSDVTGGSNGIFGIFPPEIGFGIEVGDNEFFYITLATFVVCAGLMYLLVKSPFGLALQGIRDDEQRMKHLGYNTWLFKYIVFIIGGMFAGVAGVLFAPAAFTVVPQYLGSLISATVMLMVIIGSSRVFMGPVVGAALVLFLQLIVNNWPPPWAPDSWQEIADRWELILGLTFVISVMILPGGIGVYLDRLLTWLRFRPAEEQPASQSEELPVMPEQTNRQTALAKE